MDWDRSRPRVHYNVADSLTPNPVDTVRPPNESPYNGSWINGNNGEWHPDTPSEVIDRANAILRRGVPPSNQSTVRASPDDPPTSRGRIDIRDLPEVGEAEPSELQRALSQAGSAISDEILISVAAKTLTAMAKICHRRATEKGFKNPSSYDDIEMLLAKSMLIVSEVAEFTEGARVGDDANANEEMADIFIRLFDLCGALGIDIGAEVAAKLNKNLSRPFRHGKRA